MADDSTMKFKADISQLKAAMQQASRAIKVANSEFKAATAGMDDWSDSAEGLQAKIKQLGSVLNSQKRQLELANEELEKTKKIYGENSAETDRARIKVNNYEAAVAKTEKQLGDYETALTDVENSTEDLEDATEKAKDGFTVMKGALSSLVADGIRAAISAFKDLAKETFNAGANFESAMSQVAAVSGAGADEIDKLTAKAKEMGESTKFSASESAEAFNYMAMAGWKTEDMIGGIEGIMNLAAASGADLATTSDIVTDALTAMGYSASDSAKLADVMAAASSNANTNVEMMGQTFQYAAPIVGALGYNMEDTAVAIGMMANAGIKGEKAGTALRSILTRLSAPPKECATEMEKLGISLTDSKGNMKDLDTVIKDLRKAFSKLEESEQTAAAKHIAGQEAMSGLLAVVNGAPADFNKLTKAVNESEGAAKQMADTMNDNVSGQITLLKSKIEGIMIKVFEKASGSIRKAIDSISKGLDSVDWNKFSESAGNAAEKIADLFNFVIQNAPTIVNWLKTIATAFITYKAVSTITSVYSAFTGLFKAVKSGTSIMAALNSTMLLNPYALVAAGIAGLTFALNSYVKKQQEAVIAENSLSDAQQETVDSIKSSYKEYQAANEARKEAMASVNNEYDHIRELKDEYNGLINSNGEVKKGYEDRANFIIDQLAKSLGVERSEIEKNIGKNGEFEKSIDSVIQKKQAEAILLANEADYTKAVQNKTNALNTYQEAVKIADEAEAKYKSTSDALIEGQKKYQDLLQYGTPEAVQAYSSRLAELQDANDAAKKSFEDAKTAVSDAESEYVGYNTTIKNYEGLSAAILDGDQKKIKKSLTNMQNDFITAKTGTKNTLNQQIHDFEKNYENLKKAVEDGMPGVTEVQVKEAKTLVDRAKKEFDKLPPEAESAGNKAGSGYAKKIGEKQGEVLNAGKLLAERAKTGTESETDSIEKAGETKGKYFVTGMEKFEENAKTGGKNLAKEAKKGADTKDETTDSEKSGSNFGEGFFNGIGKWLSKVFNRGKNLAQEAEKGVKEGQKEGSPSKLTFQSGVYFTQGYINGISSMQGALVKTVQNMVKTVISEMGKMDRFNFADVSANASTKFADAMSAKASYMLAKMQYQNETKIADFDKTITKLEKERDKKIAALEKKETKKNKKSIQKQIKAVKNQYTKLINTQEKYKTAYQTASSKMISEFQSAVNSYQQKAQALINDTINGITDTYNARYDELINKQDTLIDKLVGAGNLFEISGAGVMTVNDINEQTKQIKEYTAKLAKIKEKVSGELFDEIASYDMKEGGAFIDRLLAMSANDLNAYNKAYTEKLEAAQKAAESIYKSDFDKVASDYEKEINSAFKGIDKQLKVLGDQAMKGFVDGLTKNTDYLDKNVKTFVKSMVSTFKKELKIKSPSKVMFSIGEFTGEGFDNGLLSVVKQIQGTAQEIANAVSSPLDNLTADINGARSVVRTSNNGLYGGAGSNVVNNYNLVQNNTSPKALTALETYQARRRQIAMMKAATMNA